MFFAIKLPTTTAKQNTGADVKGHTLSANNATGEECFGKYVCTLVYNIVQVNGPT